MIKNVVMPARAGRSAFSLSMLDQLLPRHLAFLEKVCQYLGDVADVCRMGDDLGMDSGPFMRPETYRTLFKPRHKMLCDYVKQHSSMHTFLHCCGGIGCG